MNNFWFIVSSVLIAALIGGLTNHLAIKMLFHPRRPWYIGNWKVPFTPGLIPKRKDEISRSLGMIVGDYLVTPQGLIGLLRKPDFIRKIESRLSHAILQGVNSELTLEQLCLKVYTPEQLRNYRRQLMEQAISFERWGLKRLWKEKQWARVKVTSLIPEWSTGRKEELIEDAAGMLLQELKREMASLGMERWLRQSLRKLIEQSAGVLGALAGLFLDEDKLVRKLQEILLPQLESEALRKMIISAITRRMEQWEQLDIGQCVEWLSKQDSYKWVSEQISRMLPWEDWIETGANLTLSQVLSPHQGGLLARIPSFVKGALYLLEIHMEPLVNALELPNLVEGQVTDFPVEKLEALLLSVSGKEFRAITWLGALLGGMIGLFQAFFLLWFK